MKIKSTGAPTGGSIDLSGLTATAPDIVAPKTAITADGETVGLIDAEPLHEFEEDGYGFKICPNGAFLTFADLMAVQATVYFGDISDIPRGTYPGMHLEDYGITGSVLYLPTVTDSLILYSCYNIAGSMNDITCPLYEIKVVNAPLAGVLVTNSTVSAIELPGTLMTPSDIDATLIGLAAITEVDGGYIIVPEGRTSASDVAVATLNGLYWYVQEGD